MNIVNYKGTNLRVSDIALGGGVLGSRISDQASFDILDCFVGNGGTFIDPANEMCIRDRPMPLDRSIGRTLADMGKVSGRWFICICLPRS